MDRVYQRRARAAVALALTLAVAPLAAGCAPRRQRLPPPPAAGATADPGLLLDARSYSTPRLGADGAVWATEIGRGGARAVRVDAAGRRSDLAPGAPGESRLVALLADGRRALVELDPDPASPPTLALREADGRLLRLPPLGAGRERFLGDVGAGAFLTAVPDGAGAEAVVETGAVPGARRVVFTAPAGFRIAAASADGRRLALVRRREPGADEVVWQERATGDARLLLPLDRDGRFEPLLFTADGAALLVLAELANSPPALVRVPLDAPALVPFGSPPCPPRSLRDGGDGAAFVAEVDCRGRAEAWLADRDGRTLPAPALPAGTRLLDWSGRADSADAALLAGGAGWPADLLLAAGGETRPLTYGLAPRLPPAEVPQARPLELGAGGATFAELWSARTPGRAGCAWIDADASRELHEPVAAALAASGVRLLRVRPVAELDGAAAAGLFAAAAAALARELPAGAPTCLVLAGAQPELVTALASGPRWSELVWLWPEMPSIPAPPPVRGAASREAAPPDPLLALVASARGLPPTLLVLDAGDPASAARAAALAAGGGTQAIVARRSRLASRLLDDATRALFSRALPAVPPR